jgi:hypothetical protein
MAHAYLNLLDVAKANGSDKVVGLIEEVQSVAPEAQYFPFRTIMGTTFKALVRTALPSGAFRNVNAGGETVKSTYVEKLAQCFFYDLQMEVDEAIAGADEERNRLQSHEESGAMMGALQDLGSQIWYGTGTGGDALGFPGAVSVVDSGLVVDAGGTTESTCSSVYGVKLGPQNVSLIGGNSGTLDFSGWTSQLVDRSSTQRLRAWCGNLRGWIGCQWVNKNALGRIKKLTEDSGKGLTDALLNSLYHKFPAGMKPDAFFMSRRSLRQLQTSRSIAAAALTSKTLGNFSLTAPVPTDYNGIPIIATDMITDTETLAL